MGYRQTAGKKRRRQQANAKETGKRLPDPVTPRVNPWRRCRRPVGKVSNSTSDSLYSQSTTSTLVPVAFDIEQAGLSLRGNIPDRADLQARLRESFPETEHMDMPRPKWTRRAFELAIIWVNTGTFRDKADKTPGPSRPMLQQLFYLAAHMNILPMKSLAAYEWFLTLSIHPRDHLLFLAAILKCTTEAERNDPNWVYRMILKSICRKFHWTDILRDEEWLIEESGEADICNRLHEWWSENWRWLAIWSRPSHLAIARDRGQRDSPCPVRGDDADDRQMSIL